MTAGTLSNEVHRTACFTAKLGLIPLSMYVHGPCFCVYPKRKYESGRVLCASYICVERLPYETEIFHRSSPGACSCVRFGTAKDNVCTCASADGSRPLSEGSHSAFVGTPQLSACFRLRPELRSNLPSTRVPSL